MGLLLLGLAGWGVVFLATRHRCRDAATVLANLRPEADRADRAHAAVCLWHHPILDESETVPAAVAALSGSDADVRYHLLVYVTWRSEHLSANDLKVVRGYLEDPDPRVVRVAAGTLGRAKARSLPFLPALIDYVDRGPPATRAAAASTLGSLYAAAPAQVAAGLPALARACGSDQPKLRESAVWTLREFGPAAASATPVIVQLLANPTETTRRMASETLAKIGTPAVPALCAALKSPDLHTRQGAVSALERMKTRAAGAIEPLIDALLDDDEDVRFNAQLALHNLWPTSEVPIARRIRAGGPERGPALEFLWYEGGRHAPETTSLLRTLVSDPNLEVRRRATLAFIRKRPYQETAPLLASLLNDERDPSGRIAAAIQLGSLGAEAAPALPDLLKAADASDPRLRLEAAGACASIDPSLGPDMAVRIAPFATADDDDLRSSSDWLLVKIVDQQTKAGAPPLWWVPFRVYAVYLSLLLALTGIWFGVHRRFPRHRPRRRWAQAAYVVAVASVPAALWGGLLIYAEQTLWIAACWPESPLIAIPRAWSAPLSAGALALLAAVFVVARKSPREPTLDGAAERPSASLEGLQPALLVGPGDEVVEQERE